DVKLVDPRAKVVKKQVLKSNPAGLIAVDYAFPAFADTGHYTVELGVADKTVASYGLQVEEFVPERRKVTAATAKPASRRGDEVTVGVGARSLFGGTGAGSGVEITCAIAPARFAPKQNADLVYGVEPKGKPVALGEDKGELDDSGKATIACPAAEDKTAF